MDRERNFVNMILVIVAVVGMVSVSAGTPSNMTGKIAYVGPHADRYGQEPMVCVDDAGNAIHIKLIETPATDLDNAFCGAGSVGVYKISENVYCKLGPDLYFRKQCENKKFKLIAIQPESMQWELRQDLDLAFEYD